MRIINIHEALLQQQRILADRIGVVERLCGCSADAALCKSQTGKILCGFFDLLGGLDDSFHYCCHRAMRFFASLDGIWQAVSQRSEYLLDKPKTSLEVY